MTAQHNKTTHQTHLPTLTVQEVRFRSGGRLSFAEMEKMLRDALKSIGKVNGHSVVSLGACENGQ